MRLTGYAKPYKALCSAVIGALRSSLLSFCSSKNKQQQQTTQSIFTLFPALNLESTNLAVKDEEEKQIRQQ